MRNLNENSSTAWLVFGMMLVYLPIGLIQQSQIETESDVFGFLTELDLLDWVWVMAFGFASVLNMTTRAIAIQYEEPGRLAYINFFNPVIQLIFDLLVWQSVFTEQQIWGVIVIFAANGIKWVKSLSVLFQSKAKNSSYPALPLASSAS
jgi:EamA domain-containing membrane protein RarD